MFSPNGKALASGAGEFQDGQFAGEVKLWDPQTMELKRSWPLESNDVNALSFSPDGMLLASGGLKGISIWDVSAGALQRILPTGDTATLALAFSPDGRTLANGSFDTRLRLRDARTWEVSKTLEGHPAEVRAVVFSTDGKTLVTYPGGSKEVFLWDAEAGKLKRTFKSGHGVSAVALSSDGETLAIGSGEGLESSQGRVELWDAESGKHTKTLKGAQRPGDGAGLSPDGRTLASGSQDATVKLWDGAESLRRKPLK